MSGSPHNQAVTVSLIRRAFSVPTLVSLALAGAFLAFLVTRFHVDLPATWSYVAASNPWFLASALLVYYTTFPFRGARWRLLMRNVLGRGTAVPGVGYYGQLLLLGWFANSVSWFRLGDAYRAYLYSSEQGVSFTRTIGTIMAERFLDTILVALLLLVATLLLISRGQGASWPVLGTALGLLALVAAVLLAMGRARGWLLRRLPRRLAGYYQHFHEGSLGSLRQIPAATLWGGLGWLAEVGRLYLVVHALGLELGLPLVIFLALANSLLTLVPTPGGLGAVESGMVVLVVQLSPLTTTNAAALVVVDRAISYLSIVAFGALLFLARQGVRRRGLGPDRDRGEPKPLGPR